MSEGNKLIDVRAEWLKVWQSSALNRRIGDTLEMAGVGSERHAILMDMLWKFVRSDYHGVMDCAADMRELHL